MSLMRLLTAGRSWVGVKDPQSGYRMTDPRSMPKFEAKKNPFRAKASERTELAEDQVKADAPVTEDDEDMTVEVVASVAAEPAREAAVEAQAVVVEEPAIIEEPVNEEILTESIPGLCEPQRNEESIGLVVSDSLRSEDALRLPESQVEASVEKPARKKARVTAAITAGVEKVGGLFGSLKARAAKMFEPVASWMPKRARAAAERRVVQAELALDSIKVVRNDFREGDFELVAAVPRRVRPKSLVRPEGRATKDEQPMLMPEPEVPAEQTVNTGL